MELNTSTLSDFTAQGKIIWNKGYDSVSKVMRSSGLFKEEIVPANTGDTLVFSEIDGEEYAKKKDEGDQAQRGQVQQGYTKTMNVYRVAKDIGITYEMRTRNKYSEVTSRLLNLGYQIGNRMELDMAHRLTFATATTYVDMDGDTVDISVGDTKALAATDHSLRGSTTTYRNILANNPRLSKGALEGMERLITEQTYNQFGEKKTMSFDILWTTDDPNTVNTAREYLQSTADVEGLNSGVKNVYSSKYRHVVLPLVATNNVGAVDTDKRYYWGLASSMNTQAHLGIWEEPHLLSPMELGKDTTEDWNFGARGGYGICSVSGTWIKLSKGDASA